MTPRRYSLGSPAERADLRRWLVVSSPLVALASVQLVLGRPADALELVAIAGAMSSIGALALVRPAWTVRVLSVLFAALVLVAVAEFTLAPRGWGPDSSSWWETMLQRESTVITGQATRTWALPEGTRRITFRADAELEGDPSLSWYPSDDRVVLAPRPSSTRAEGATRIRFPLGQDPYAQRTYDLGRPAGGLTVRASIDVWTDGPVEGACAGLRVQVRGPGGGHRCSDVPLSGGWVRQSVVWTVPSKARDPVVRLVLNDLNGRTVDVRDAHLEHRAGSTWRVLAPLSPTVPTLSVDWGDGRGATRALRGLAAGDVGRIEATFPVPEGASPDTATLRIEAFPGRLGSLRLSRTRLDTGGAARAASGAAAFRRWGRVELWMGHPNLAGHTTVAIGGALATVAPAWAWMLLPITILVALTTGSRAAVAGAAVFVALWLLSRRFTSAPVETAAARSVRSSPRGATWAVVVVVAVAMVVLAGSLVRRDVDNPTSRIEIWTTSSQALQAQPWRGIGGAAVDFRAFWEATYLGDSREPVGHPHSLVLRFGVAYGVPGLAALASVLVLWAGFLHRTRRFGPVALLAGLLVANVVDDTLFYAYVLVPMVVASTVRTPRPTGRGT